MLHFVVLIGDFWLLIMHQSYGKWVSAFISFLMFLIACVAAIGKQ